MMVAGALCILGGAVSIIDLVYPTSSRLSKVMTSGPRSIVHTIIEDPGDQEEEEDCSAG